MCAGTAALSFALFHAKPVVPMTGSKRSLAKTLLREMGLESWRPTRLVLVEPGEWGRTHATCFGPGGWEAVARVFDRWAEAGDARPLFDRLRGEPPSADPAERAATHLFLQTRTYRGKPVFVRPDGTGWVTHGFDAEFRLATNEGTARGSHSRGWFNARPVMAEKLRALGRVAWPEVRVVHATALQALSRGLLGELTSSVVYLDPPYAGTLGYGPGCGFPREEVLMACVGIVQLGLGVHAVHLSEGADLGGLLGDAWEARPLERSANVAKPADPTAPESWESGGQMRPRQMSRHAEWLVSRRRGEAEVGTGIVERADSAAPEVGSGP